MLQITLSAASGLREPLPPISRVTASGPHLLVGEDPEVIAGEYVGRGWRINGKERSMVEIDGPLIAAFEDGGMHAALGPFPNLLIVGDALFAGGAYLARYDHQDQKWHLNEAQPWSSVVIAALKTSTNARVERHRMIAEAAYYRAQKRGFAPGGELADWFAAELHAGDIGTCPSCRQRWLLLEGAPEPGPPNEPISLGAGDAKARTSQW